MPLLLLLACSSTEEPVLFLGPVSAPSFTPPPPPLGGLSGSSPCGASISPPEAVQAQDCSLLLQADPGASPSLAHDGQGYLVNRGSSIESRPASASGCPGTAAGLTSLGSLSAGPIARNTFLWVARADSVDAFAGSKLAATCSLASVRALAPDPSSPTRAWAATPQDVVPLDLAEGVCTVGPRLPLPGAPLALAASSSGGLWVARVGCDNAPLVERYLLDGSLDPAAPTVEGGRFGLCSVRAISEHGELLTLLDSSCRQAFTLDASTASLVRRWAAPAGLIPLGAAAFDGGVGLLASASTSDGPRLRFFSLPDP